jgi:UDP-N-acetylmuramate dehydrogenase
MAMDMSDNARMQAGLSGIFRRDEPMSKHVSWRAGGRTRAFYQPADVADLCVFLRSLGAEEPVLFVGLGSNLLVRDGGFPGAVVFTHRSLTGIVTDGARREELVLRVGAGVPAPHLARFVAKHGGAGAEWMAGIPGTIGGALAMNAGCYGGETWNHVVAVETVDRSGALVRRPASDFDLGYRHVHLKSGADEWFVSGIFAFEPGEEAAAMARIRSLLSKRVATQPLNQPNAGSVFRNPPNDHAARLIESCGLKGFTIGGALVSPKHANFIVNLGNATAKDIESVMEHVEATVAAKTGVALVREVRIVGNE